jgi:hypothetical protein
VKPIPTPKNVVAHLRAMHNRLNDGWANVDDAWWTTEAAAIIERLVFQRDEAEAAKNTLQAALDDARREVCAHEADTVEDQCEYAKQRGWWSAFRRLEETARESYKGGD